MIHVASFSDWKLLEARHGRGEKPEWQKMRQMEVQIQQLLERSSEAEIKAEVERQVAARVDAAMGRLKAGINF